MNCMLLMLLLFEIKLNIDCQVFSRFLNNVFITSTQNKQVIIKRYDHSQLQM